MTEKIKYDHAVDYAKLLNKQIKIPSNFKDTGNHVYGCINGLYYQAYCGQPPEPCPYIFYISRKWVDGRCVIGVEKAKLEFLDN